MEDESPSLMKPSGNRAETDQNETERLRDTRGAGDEFVMIRLFEQKKHP